MPLASAAALLLVVGVGVRLLCSTMEGASHRQQAVLSPTPDPDPNPNPTPNPYPNPYPYP